MGKLVPVIVASAVALTAPAAALGGPIQTAVTESADTPAADVAISFARDHDAGATAVRLYVSWSEIAPQALPASFDPANPADPAYNWASLDTVVNLAIHDGLQPILSVDTAPTWAEGSSAGLSAGDQLPGTIRPNAAAFGQFAQAIATRYSGSFGGLPRVRLWQAWNEPNHHLSLSPQFSISPTQPATLSTPMESPEIYRAMVNAFAAAVHGVHPDNLVIAGGLAPFFRPDVDGHAAAPFPFMRQLLCMSSADRPLPGCNKPVSFDIWAMDPYTSGDPEHKANSPQDASFGDLPRVAHLLRAAVRAHHVVSSAAVRFWITEFSWDSKPPDPFGAPVALETRWVADALYRAWSGGISLLTWFQTRDDPASFDSGLYYACPSGPSCDQPKPILAAFRFPFVAYRQHGRVLVWGRTPGGSRGVVVVEQRAGARWRRLARLHADRYGVFTTKLRTARGGDLRARTTGGVTSAPFSLHVPPDFPVNPFGHTPVNEPSKSGG